MIVLSLGRNFILSYLINQLQIAIRYHYFEKMTCCLTALELLHTLTISESAALIKFISIIFHLF